MAIAAKFSDKLSIFGGAAANDPRQKTQSDAGLASTALLEPGDEPAFLEEKLAIGEPGFADDAHELQHATGASDFASGGAALGGGRWWR